MNEQALNELLECSVCLEQLDDTSKVLPCQHTFCKRCLEEIVSTKHELRCPECRFLVEMRVDELPSNILLIRLLEGLKTQSRSSGVSGRRKESGGSPTKGDKSVQSVTAFARQQQQRQAVAGSRPCAKALFNYDAKDPGDLSFKKGDIVYLRKQVDENWFHGEFNNQHGFFPATYVQVITSLPSTIPQCLGLYDFNPDTEEDCLGFKKDEIVTVIRKVDDNWLEGKKGEKIGIFPLSFVQLNEPAKILLRLTNKTSSSSSHIGPPVTPAHPGRPIKECSPINVPPNKRHSLTTLSQNASTHPAQSVHRLSLDSNTAETGLLAAGGLPATMTTQAAAMMSQAVPLPMSSGEGLTKNDKVLTKSETEATIADQSSGIVGTSKSDPLSVGFPLHIPQPDDNNSAAPIYIALYNYKPQKVDELELIKGDYYSVGEKCMDGWYKGMALKSSIAGVFPGNYVQAVKTHTSSNKSSSKPKLAANNQSLVSGAGASNSLAQSTISPPRPATSSLEAVGRSRSKPDFEGTSKSRLDNEGSSKSRSNKNGSSGSAERGNIPPPIVPRHSNIVVPLPIKASKSSSSSSPSSPVLSTGHKTTRYVRASKSTSPNIGAKSDTSIPAATSASSPVWKHSMANIPPPKMVVVAGATNSGAKEKKKDKEKLSLMKRLTSGGKSKKSKSIDNTDVNSLSDTSIVHSRSGSYPCEVSVPVLPEGGGHKKTASFDSSSTSPSKQTKPTRPKPLVRETYRCVETYPAQSEIELDLKIGDVIYVHKKRDDGWFKGTLQRSGKTGLFPGSFAEKYS